MLEEERWSPGLLQIGNKILHIGTGSADLRAGPDVGGQPRCQATNGKTLFQGPASREIDQPELSISPPTLHRPCLIEGLLKESYRLRGLPRCLHSNIQLTFHIKKNDQNRYRPSDSDAAVFRFVQDARDLHAHDPTKPSPAKLARDSISKRGSTVVIGVHGLQTSPKTPQQISFDNKICSRSQARSRDPCHRPMQTCKPGHGPGER